MMTVQPQRQSWRAATALGDGAGSPWRVLKSMTHSLEEENAAAIVAQAKRRPLALRVVGQGPAFVLFHGGFGSWTHWIRNVDVLARHYRVVAFDLPGYGESPDVPAELTADQYFDWVTDSVMEAAPHACHVAGFSFGAALAARICARLGRRVVRLSLVGPGGFGVPVGRVIPVTGLPGRDADAATRRAVAAANLGQWMLTSAPSPDDPVVNLQLANIDRTRFDSRRISFQATLCADLARMTAPVQIIWGEFDKLAYPSIESRAEECRRVRPDLRITVVGDGGHWVQYERADEVNRLLLDFHRMQ